MADVFEFARKKLFGPRSKRYLRKLHPLVDRINALEPAMKQRSDDELRALTAVYRQRIEKGESLDALLPEAFATCREGGRRVLGMRHFDVQLLGGMVLHKGSIAEMRTGEGKTLVATLPACLNALDGRGLHVVTVNDYLARRDAEWMGRLYRFLGMNTGIIVHGLSDEERQESYRADITYGTNSEFGFDYLRDNMKPSIERYVQRELHYAIVDEVDSILIDEARTPLIISGRPEASKDLYFRVNQVIPSLKKDVDYTVDEKAHSAMLTDAGVEKVEKKLGLPNLYDPENVEWNHHVQQALRAHTLYKRDVNYVVEEAKVIIIDEFTGRKMPGRRWSDGLHQAIEAKENVTIEEETQTLATVTYQNFFRMYHKLSGMTGTAETEAQEFTEIYRLGVIVVPTNLPMIRNDVSDLVYKNEKGKFRAVLDEIVDCHERGQPVLVGTVSVEKSEVLAQMLKKKGIPHSVLNAKQHAREAMIVAQAGRKGALTISTNMAGRGTDIVLGGNAEVMATAEVDPATEPDQHRDQVTRYKAQCAAEREEVLAAGGLHILGTERHESRRIDNQLRGRSGRQGDPGSSHFYLSLEDDLLRIFGAERMTGLMERLGMEEDVPIEHSMVNRAIENAQRKVEGHNFDIRKNLLEYDDVMNQQRMTLYALRRQVLEGRYVRELSQDERKRGVEAEIPTSSGDVTIERLADQVRPQIVQIVDAWQKQNELEESPYRQDGRTPEEREAAEKATASASEPTPADGGSAPAATSSAAPASSSAEGTRRKRARRLKHEIYKWFGAVVELEDVVGEREKIIERASREAGASLVQQRERVLDLFDQVVGSLMDEACPPRKHADEYRIDDLEVALKEQFGLDLPLRKVDLDRDKIGDAIWRELEKLVQTKELELTPLGFLYFARHLYLEEIDAQWIDHLKSMEHLREGVGLVGYGQKDPKQEYKMEGFNMFIAMMARIQANVARNLSRLRRVTREEQAASAQTATRGRSSPSAARMAANGANGAPGGNGKSKESAPGATGASGAAALLTDLPEFKHKERRTVETGGDGAALAPDGRSGDGKAKPVVRDQPKVGRNDPCPCGSGKKYKKCHGLGATL